MAAPPARNGASDLAWQEVALGAPRGDSGALAELLALPPEGTLALSSGYLDPRLQPTAALAAALARAGRRPGAWERGEVEGVAALRAWFAREAGGRFAAHDVVICPGARRRSSPPCARSPRPAARSSSSRRPTAARSRPCGRGADPGPVPSDADGVRPALLAAALERTGARVAYLQPLHANPHGADLSAARRAEVMEIAARAGAFLIEDDWARDLTIDGPAPAPLAADDADGHVVYVRSLSKGASPGLRVAAVAARGPAGARLRSARVVEDLFVSAPAPARRARARLLTGPAPSPARAAGRAARAPRRAGRHARPSTSGRRRSGASRPAGCTCGCGCPTAPTSRR